MPTFLQSLAGTAPVLIVLLLARTLNVPRAVRVRQYLLPPIAAVYLIGALVVLYPLNSWLDSLLGGLFRVIPVLQTWYSTAWLYVIENTVVILVWLAIKLILRPVFRRVGAEANFFASSLVAGVYVFDADYETWFVQRRLGSLRTFYRVLTWFSLAVAIGLIALVDAFPAWPGFLAISFPALAALLIAEISYSLDGVTRPEYESDVFGEDDTATRVVQYGGLREIYRETFGDRTLDTSISLSSTDPKSSFARLDELSRSSSDVDRIASAYFGRLKASGRELDINLLDATTRLLHDVSVVVSNPFYNDLTDYLAFPVYYRLLQYGKCLIIAGRDSAASDLAEWITAGLESITGVPDLWRVDVLDERNSRELDVGVLRFADIHNLDLIAGADDFFGEVAMVILAEPSRMLTTAQVGLGLVLARCGRSSAPVFAVFDRNHDGLVDALSHLLRTNLTTVVASALPYGAGSQVVWRGDGPPMHTAILPEITRYLGLGTEIGAVALKYQVSRVEWVGADVFPVEDMSWIAGQYYGQLSAFAGLDVSQHAISESIVPVANPWELSRSDNRFLVVEDEISNVYESIRLYATRADKQGFVNLISSDYLLRDYMVANRQIFEADPKAVPSFVPDFARTERNAVFRLVLTLLAFEVGHDDLVRELELIGVRVPEPDAGDVDGRDRDGEEAGERTPPTVVELRSLIERHTGIRNAPVTWSSQIIDEGVGVPKERVSYRIARGSRLDEVVAQLKPAYFFVEDEAVDENYIGAALFGHVYQLLLPGQFVTHAGKYYQVQSIGESALRNGVVLRRAAEHIDDRRTYRQLRRFTIADIESTGRVGTRIVDGGVGIRRVPATMSVQSLGYVEQTGRSGLGTGHRVEIEGIPARQYREKEVLEITLPDVPPSVRKTIALLLNELFVTIFPHSVPFIVALTPDEEGEFGDLLAGFTSDGPRDAIYLVEDSVLDLGLILSVERNWRRLLEIVADFLTWRGGIDGSEPEPEEPSGVDADDLPEPHEPEEGLGAVDFAMPNGEVVVEPEPEPGPVLEPEAIMTPDGSAEQPAAPALAATAATPSQDAGIAGVEHPGAEAGDEPPETQAGVEHPEAEVGNESREAKPGVKVSADDDTE
ncbi:hypothetical protein [Humibacter albus]|uniref:hypothetical protein n=1 Tax=Humibacter albus TaxID=427754 RepID=UPI0003B472E8|nr:hypothetical protein [Humibacter albus]